MEKKPETLSVTVRVRRDLWEKFRENAKLLNSDAAKEMRKFIERYVRETQAELDKTFS